MKLCVMTSLVEIAQSVRVEKADWKNIEQRKVDAKRGRRAKKQGMQAAAAGAPGAALMGATVGATIDSAFKAGHPKPVRNTLKNAANPLRFAPKQPFTEKVALTAARASVPLAAGGLGYAAYGKLKERHAEDKIKVMRKKRDKVEKGAPSLKTLAAVTDPRKAAKMQGRLAAKIKASGGSTWGDVARRGSESRAASRGISTNGKYGQDEAHLRSGVAPWQLASKADVEKGLNPLKSLRRVKSASPAAAPSAPKGRGPSSPKGSIDDYRHNPANYGPTGPEGFRPKIGELTPRQADSMRRGR